MQAHFLHRYILDTMVILEEENLPYPRCPQFNMMVPWRTLMEGTLLPHSAPGERSKRDGG